MRKHVETNDIHTSHTRSTIINDTHTTNLHESDYQNAHTFHREHHKPTRGDTIALQITNLSIVPELTVLPSHQHSIHRRLLRRAITWTCCKVYSTSPPPQTKSEPLTIVLVSDDRPGV